MINSSGYSHQEVGAKIGLQLESLRPISLCSTMAQVQDALWVLRNKGKMEFVCGPHQVCGISGPVSLLALVTMGQLRHSQGLATYLAFTDLMFAFDLADRPSMKINIHKAGVTGVDELLWTWTLFAAKFSA